MLTKGQKDYLKTQTNNENTSEFNDERLMYVTIYKHKSDESKSHWFLSASEYTNSTEITFELFCNVLAIDASESYVLLERWCVRATPETLMTIAGYWDSVLKTTCYQKNSSSAPNGYSHLYWYSHNVGSGNSMYSDEPGANYFMSKKKEGFTEITFEQLNQYVLKKNTVDREIKWIAEHESTYTCDVDQESKEKPVDKECKFNKGDRVEALTDMILPAEWIETPPGTIVVYTILEPNIVLEVKGTTIRLTDNPNLWFESKHFKLAPMDKELIGYKVKEEYAEFAKLLLSISLSLSTEYLIRTPITFEPNDKWADKCKKAGVLDLWFDPVYKEQFQKGDWVIGESNGCIYVGLYSNHKRMSEWMPTCTDTWIENEGEFEQINRLATPEEISIAKTYKYKLHSEALFAKVDAEIERLLEGTKPKENVNSNSVRFSREIPMDLCLGDKICMSWEIYAAAHKLLK